MIPHKEGVEEETKESVVQTKYRRLWEDSTIFCTFLGQTSTISYLGLLMQARPTMFHILLVYYIGVLCCGVEGTHTQFYTVADTVHAHR